MKQRRLVGVVGLCGALLSVACTDRAPSNRLTVAISPYQDIAMLVAAPAQGFDTASGVSLDLRSMPWEEIPSSVASAAGAVDVGFASLAEYLTKQGRMNAGTTDSLLFIYPLYVYRGGGFVSFLPNVPVLDSVRLKDVATVRKFLSMRIGAQRNSIYEMIVDALGARVGDSTAATKIIDTQLNDGLLAAEKGSLDIAAAGLTQLAEAEKRGGRTVLRMDDLGFADITGLLVRRSVLDKKRPQIEGLIRAWFASVNFVMADIEKNSAASLVYLKRNAATQYTLEQYTSALAPEYLPTNIAEATASFITPGGRYDASQIANRMADYLVRTKKVSSRPIAPTYIHIPPK